MGNCLEAALKKWPIVEEELKDLYELYESLERMPPDFNPSDKERIKIFSERLKLSRKSVKSRNAQIKYLNGKEMEGPRYCFITKQEEVAKWLEVTPQRISQLENGKIKAIPVAYLREFYNMFDVTPHYLVGYTDDPDGVLDIRDGKPILNEDGTYRILHQVLTYPVLSQEKAMKILSALAWRKTGWFLTLCNFLSASDQTMEAGFKILDVLLEKDKKMQQNENS